MILDCKIKIDLQFILPEKYPLLILFYP